MPEPTFTIRKGMDLALPGAPGPTIETGPSLRQVALLAADFPQVRPRLAVHEGDRVRVGETLFTDRRHPRLRFTSPASGVVSRILTGEQRPLRSIVIAVDGDDAQPFPLPDASRIATTRREDVEELLLASGLWTTLRTRPFGSIPVPGTQPADVFVTAIDTHPLAPRPEAIVAGRGSEFALGLAALARLTQGRVYVCQAPGPDLPRPDEPRIVVARFDGPHPAGLPGTHIHLLAPVSRERMVWHVGYQDVIAMGSLLMTGTLPVERVVALAGPAVRRPRLLRTRLGAALWEILRDELEEEGDGTSGRFQVISGSVLAGRTVTPEEGYLGARDRQICVLPARGAADWVPVHGSRPRAFVAVPAYDRVLPMDIPPAPLLRALLLEDDEAAVELGALELDEDDLALLGFVCPSRQDYGPLLRAALSRIQAGQ